MAAKVHQSDLRACSHKGESLIVSGSECYCGGRNCRALSAGQRQAVRSGRERQSGRRAAGRVDVMFMWWPVQPFPPPPADGHRQRALMRHTGQRGSRAERRPVPFTLSCCFSESIAAFPRPFFAQMKAACKFSKFSTKCSCHLQVFPLNVCE